MIISIKEYKNLIESEMILILENASSKYFLEFKNVWWSRLSFETQLKIDVYRFSVAENLTK